MPTNNPKQTTPIPIKLAMYLKLMRPINMRHKLHANKTAAVEKEKKKKRTKKKKKKKKKVKQRIKKRKVLKAEQQ